MYESGNYHPGAEHDPRAPWNETQPEPVLQDIEYSCTMRRATSVETTDSIPGHVHKEWDGEGFIAARDGDDFSCTDWLEEFKAQNRTPPQLIDLLKETARQLATGTMPKKPVNFWRFVVEECEGWEIDDQFVDTV